MMAHRATSTIGQYLAARFLQVGMRHYFALPEDYNLVLLDELLRNRNLRLISCCNELNASYAADGYARATGGPSAIVVTFSVGGLSAINGIAGAYAESLPVIVVSGGPNTNSEAENELDIAITRALAHAGPSLIEVAIDRDDCSKSLLEWGRHVAANNGRPPRAL